MQLQFDLLVFVFVASFTPGPNNIMIMASGLNHGIKASWPHFFGIVLGVPTLLLAIGFGLGYVFEQFEWLHLFIQIVGISYLLYLSYLIATSKPASLSTEASKPLTFFQATLFQWVNPKAWIMGTSALATYSVVGSDPVWQILGIVAVFFIFTFPAVGAWLVFGAALQKLFANPKHQTRFNRLMALLLMLSISPSLRELLIYLFA